MVALINLSFDYVFSICSLWFFFLCFPCPAFLWIIECSVHFLVWVTHGSAQMFAPRVRNPFHQHLHLASSSFYSGVGMGEFLLSFIYFMVVVRLITYCPPQLLCSWERWLGSITAGQGRLGGPFLEHWGLQPACLLSSFSLLMFALCLSSGVLLVLGRSDGVECAPSCLKLEMWSVAKLLIISIILMWPLFYA